MTAESFAISNQFAEQHRHMGSIRIAVSACVYVYYAVLCCVCVGVFDVSLYVLRQKVMMELVQLLKDNQQS